VKFTEVAARFVPFHLRGEWRFQKKLLLGHVLSTIRQGNTRLLRYNKINSSSTNKVAVSIQKGVAKQFIINLIRNVINNNSTRGLVLYELVHNFTPFQFACKSIRQFTQACVRQNYINVSMARVNRKCIAKSRSDTPILLIDWNPLKPIQSAQAVS
jgi:hypothetical protein